MTLRIATRRSALALWQAEEVRRLLVQEAGLEPGEVVLVPLDTMADRRLDIPIDALGGKGVFAKEVQEAVLDGRADLAVHSAKDLPSQGHDGLHLGAFPERGDVRDALVGATLASLPTGGVVATGSIRRRVQLAALRPDLRFEGLRGNMQTRLDKAAGYDAIVVAAVALARLGLADRLTEVLEPATMLPQVAQGALAVECRAGDDSSAQALAAIDHGPTRRRVTAERAFLAELGGDCDLPAGALATLDGDQIVLEGLLASRDGSVLRRQQATGTDPAALGIEVARRLAGEVGP